ncbi:MAG: peptidoglycan-associated lipoprotein Pal [Alphaproteobacteria bacterium]
MRFKVLAALAAVSLLAACSSSTEEAATTDNSGQAQAAAPEPAPEPIAEVPLTIEQQYYASVGDRVFFVVDRSDLSAEAQGILDEQASFLAANPGVTITVEGHADERGTDDYNLALSARRAASVRDYLIARGVAAGRITTLAYGESRPVATGSNEAAWAQNRRSVTVLTGGLGS